MHQSNKRTRLSNSLPNLNQESSANTTRLSQRDLARQRQQRRRSQLNSQEQELIRSQDALTHRIRYFGLSDEELSARRTQDVVSHHIRNIGLSQDDLNARRISNANSHFTRYYQLSQLELDARRIQDANTHNIRYNELSQTELDARRTRDAISHSIRFNELSQQELIARRNQDATSHSIRHNEMSHDELTQRRIQDALNHRNLQTRRQNTTRNIARLGTTLASRHLLDRMNNQCSKCSAFFWIEEKSSGSMALPVFTKCCLNGKISLPPLSNSSEVLELLYNGDHPLSREFLQNIRAYNSALSFTSLKTNLDITSQRFGVFTYRIHGSLYHLIGSLLPLNEQPAFMQIYFYDTDNEINNRLNHFNNLNAQLIRVLQTLLHQTCPYIGLFRQAIEKLQSVDAENVHMVIRAEKRNIDLRTYNLPTNSDIAVIMPGDGSDEVIHRDVLVEERSSTLKHFNELNSNYDPLQYVLLFPNGDLGYQCNIPQQENTNKHVTLREYYAYRIHYRSSSSFLHKGRRLFLQYVTDQYAKIEQDRLNYLKSHQTALRADVYQGLDDAIEAGTSDAATVGRRIILPSTFVNSHRYMIQKYEDAMAIVSEYGKPDYFITFTCNPNWTEITNELIFGQKAMDRPDLVCRVFKIKLKELKNDLYKRGVLGKVVANIDVIEFQKRGLPHCHMLIILTNEDKPRNPDDYDIIICAELPSDPNSELFETISKCMIHGPCGVFNSNRDCMKNGKCSKKYPRDFIETTQQSRDGFPIYRRRNNGRTVRKGNVILDNRWVVPYNSYLSNKYNAHINVEICDTIRAVKYLYKYVYKGHDRAVVEVNVGNNGGPDEIKTYLNTRYVSSSESVWRIFSFPLHMQFPNTIRLAVHLPNQQYVFFDETSNLQEVVGSAHETTLTGFFNFNSKINEEENTNDYHIYNKKYSDIAKWCVWNMRTKCWKKRANPPSNTVARMYLVHLSEGERYFLRLMLNHIFGPKSFEDLRTVNGVCFGTYKAACLELGLLEDDREWDKCLEEASLLKSGKCLRKLFALILLFGNPIKPEDLWNKFQMDLCEDIIYNMRRVNNNAEINQVIINIALNDIETALALNNQTLINFPNMPLPTQRKSMETSRLLSEELSFNQIELLAKANESISLLNANQRTVYDTIMESVDNERQKQFFIDGPGGTGKTYLYNTILNKVRSNGNVALAVASSGISSLLLEKGRTAHSRFKIPLIVHETSTCAIPVQSDLASLIKQAKIIIWDEAPMTHKHAFECVDRSFRDIMSSVSSEFKNVPFGGKIIVFGGDFRQILPVVRHGTRSDIVHASINNSFLWPRIDVLRLTINMGVELFNHDGDNIQHFSNYLLKIGDGTANDANENVFLPNVCLNSDKIENLIKEVFPSLRSYDDILNKTILTPKNEDVDIINDKLINAFSGEPKHYYSVDSAEESNNNRLNTSEFLNRLNFNGPPPHKLTLKIGTPVMLLRNLNPSEGLCNGTQLICKSFHQHVIDGEILSGVFKGKRVFIPRISLIPSHSGLPFNFKRKQFPIKPSFAMTINQAQGQTLESIGLYLPDPVFSHGQLYVALTRVYSDKCIKILNLSLPQTVTKNVVYKEIFSSI